MQRSVQRESKRDGRGGREKGRREGGKERRRKEGKKERRREAKIKEYKDKRMEEGGRR